MLFRILTRRCRSAAVPQLDLALLVGIGGTRRLQSAVDLGANQCRVLKQADDFAPHDLIEQILAHRPAVAQRPVEMAPGIGTQAAVVEDGGAEAGDRLDALIIRRRFYPGGAVARRPSPPLHSFPISSTTDAAEPAKWTEPRLSDAGGGHWRGITRWTA